MTVIRKGNKERDTISKTKKGVLRVTHTKPPKSDLKKLFDADKKAAKKMI